MTWRQVTVLLALAVGRALGTLRGERDEGVWRSRQSESRIVRSEFGDRPAKRLHASMVKLW